MPFFRFARRGIRRDKPRVRIHSLPAGPIATNAYLLTNADRGEALLIDAPHGVFERVKPLLEQEGCRLVALLLTHGHWDHTGDAAEIQAAGVPLHAHEADRPLIETPRVMEPFMIPGLEVAPARIDHVLEDRQQLNLLGHNIEIRHVPGHCPGNVLFYFPASEAAFVGDALFSGGIGRTDFPGGDFGVLENSIRERIYTLPPETAVYSGHGPATTVGQEMRSNPYVRA